MSYDDLCAFPKQKGKQKLAIKCQGLRDQNRQMLLCPPVPILLCFLKGFLSMASSDHCASPDTTPREEEKRGETIHEMKHYFFLKIRFTRHHVKGLKLLDCKEFKLSWTFSFT